MIRTIVFVFAGLAAMANAVNFSCPINHVLAVSLQSDREIDMNPVPTTICGEPRTCAYTRGFPCLSKGQYLSAIGEHNGNMFYGCCLITPPVQDHQGDDCHETFIESTSAGQSSFQRPPIPANRGAGHGDDQEHVMMQVNHGGAGQPNQLVKAIKKIKSNNMEGYSCTVCTPRCGRSTTTKRPSTPTHHHSHENDQHQQQQPNHDDKPPKKGLFHGQHCFSSDMTVTTPAGTKRMDEILAGDQVLVMTSDSKPIYEPIEWLYHRDPAAEVDFITVITESKRTLRLSANHLIPIVPCSRPQMKSVSLDHLADSQSFFARRLRVGHCIATLTDDEFVPDRIVEVAQERKRGIYSPITSRGTIVVNDVYVSCYSSVENHLAQKAVHSTLIKARRIVSSIWNSIFGSALPSEDSNIPVPLQIILKMAQFVVPSNVFGY